MGRVGVCGLGPGARGRQGRVCVAAWDVWWEETAGELRPWDLECGTAEWHRRHEGPSFGGVAEAEWADKRVRPGLNRTERAQTSTATSRK